MKSSKYQKRFYRNWSYPRDLFSKIVVFRETDLQILCDKPIDPEYVLARVEKYRRQIEAYICRDERFLTTLKPLAVELTAPKIVRQMADCARKADVGPMATVAGAIAQYLGKDLLREGAKTVIIENGGDIFLKSTRPVQVGLFAGKTRLLSRLKLKIKPQDTPLGVCSSSGTIGHSLSFGNADCVAIIAKNALLADAAATATANRVKDKKDLDGAIKLACSIKGVRGVVIICKNKLASWGEIEFA
jgi:ApbE superfamily uncharacterized protein (UPF0280 family)